MRFDDEPGLVDIITHGDFDESRRRQVTAPTFIQVPAGVDKDGNRRWSDWSVAMAAIPQYLTVKV